MMDREESAILDDYVARIDELSAQLSRAEKQRDAYLEALKKIGAYELPPSPQWLRIIGEIKEIANEAINKIK